MVKKLVDWIETQRAGPFSFNANQPTSNVFIADFIELYDFTFVRAVIELNKNIFNAQPISETNDNDIDDNESNTKTET